MPWETAEDVAADGEDEAQDAADGAANCNRQVVLSGESLREEGVPAVGVTIHMFTKTYRPDR